MYPNCVHTCVSRIAERHPASSSHDPQLQWEVHEVVEGAQCDMVTRFHSPVNHAVRYLTNKLPTLSVCQRLFGDVINLQFL